ncbi:MAG TPA: hypothetical protein VKA84_09610 [Gemmatimonadaceae bacterium]|nr:hypothetical protein [Gemmatimonadaceae bacterium]
MSFPLGAQVKPNARWRTLQTEHFRVHFTPELEDLARRAGANAEAAYAALSRELVAPRGPIDLVVADNVDYTNGSATPFPSNRIVVYASPPVDVASLRLYSDWNSLVVSHELTHIFHLDRSRGWWRAAQYVFGRNPLLFPNAYTPSWITEGLAVYYETRITGSGRLAGTHHAMVARAGVQGGALLRLDELSLSTPRYPGGDVAYGYGALLLDFLARTHGREGVRRFVDRTAVQPIPFFYGAAARRSFGVTLERGWREWRDSLVRAERRFGADSTPMPGWRDLTRTGRTALFPRWDGAGSIVYSGGTGRETPAAYRLDAAGAPADRGRRLGRRNGAETPNVPLPGGGLLFAQLDYTDPFTLRGDLYAQRGRHQHRLTRGARLSAPDARGGDGAIVSVQAVPSTTRLVRVSPDGRDITPLTGASPDTQWSEPRWSPEGARIAAIRWARGGRSDLVVLDTAGRVLQVVEGSGMVESAPSWSPDGRALLFASDRSGTSQLYEVALDGASDGAQTSARARRLSDAAAGIFQPALSPDGRTLAAALFRADGYHIGVAPWSGADAARVPDDADTADARARPAMPPAARAEGAASRYRPWRSLLPRYWLPVLTQTDVITSRQTNDLAYGASTSGRDVVGRHDYSAQLAVPPNRTEEPEGGVGYRYAGLGRPLLDASAVQSWEHFDVTDNADRFVGLLSQRERALSLAATLERPRVRTFGSLSIGASREWETFTRTEPAPLFERLDFRNGRELTTQGAFVSGVWSNAQRPELSISPEDGLSLSGSVEERWLTGIASGSWTRLTGIARVYKSLDLPGFAHHVVAARAAGGLVSRDATDDLDVGGTSGSSLELFPGYAVGTSSRRFGVRGFPAAAESGTRAAAGSVEYRAPLLLPARGYRLLPLFVSRTSATLFADGAAAWCPAAQAELLICRGASTRPRWLASAGAELNVDVALQYDVPYRFRFGLAAPVAERSRASDAVVAYFTVGSAF